MAVAIFLSGTSPNIFCTATRAWLQGGVNEERTSDGRQLESEKRGCFSHAAGKSSTDIMQTLTGIRTVKLE